VDDKGRLAIPASFRKQLPEGSFVSVGMDGALVIYPPDLGGPAQSCGPLPGPRSGRCRAPSICRRSFEPDGQGRIIPSGAAPAGGDRSPSSVVVTGSGSRVEIWPEDRWDNYSADAQGRFTEFADRATSGT
jgi:DNA-binding transcriptional regulator/RsmH inhibitor MraZ